MEPVEVNNDEEKHASNYQNECYDEIDISDYQKRKKYTWFKAPEIKKDWECPICKEIMRNPVKLNNVSAHTFCKQCIKTWLKNHKTNPLTGEKMKGSVILKYNDKVREEIKNLFLQCNEAKQKIQNYYVPQHGYGDYIPLKSATAKVAEKFHNENLKHLEGDFYWTPWAKEQWDSIQNMSFPSNDEDLREQSLRQIDEMENCMHQSIANRFDAARNDVRNADPNDAEMHQQIQQQLQEDVSCFRKIINGICWFFKFIFWDVPTWPFRKIGQLVCWLFGWNRNDNDDNDIDQQIR